MAWQSLSDECVIGSAPAKDISLVQTTSRLLDRIPSVTPQVVTLEPDSALFMLNAMRSQKPAEWFGHHAPPAESTFDGDAVSKGLDVELPHVQEASWAAPLWTELQVPTEYFEESKSGGQWEAWQTSYPTIEDALERPRAKIQKAREEARSSILGYIVADDAQKLPGWFDHSVDQVDYFGRKEKPDEGSRDWYAGWTERRRSVSLTCDSPGCSVDATLQAYDSDVEDARLCQLSVSVHATDFDKDHSDEFMQLSVNGHVLGHECDPMRRECNTSIPGSDRPMYTCVRNAMVHHLATQEHGMLRVQGNISHMVDECPVDGHLLSAIAVVSCLVHIKDQSTAGTSTGGKTISPLICDTPGCVANTTVFLNTHDIGNTSCHMSIVVNHTDFDGDEEDIEWVQVQGVTLKENVNPGRNPCNERSAGEDPMLPGEEEFLVVQEHDVTEQAKQGYITVAAKLSELVDECAMEGALLSGEVIVVCQ